MLTLSVALPACFPAQVLCNLLVAHVQVYQALKAMPGGRQVGAPGLDPIDTTTPKLAWDELFWTLGSVAAPYIGTS